MKRPDTEDDVTPALPRLLRVPRAFVALPLLAASAILPACSDRTIDPSAMGRRDPAYGYGTWHPALSEVPKAISESDADLYRQIFAYQQQQDWGAADRLIAQLKDRSLLGHVLAARYLDGYPAKPAELRQWLAQYSELPDASRIAALARGNGRTAPAHKRRLRRHADAGDPEGGATTSRKPKPRPDYRHRAYTARGVGTVQGSYQLQLRRGNYEAAESILNGPNASACARISTDRKSVV